MAKEKKQVTEEELLKALNDLEVTAGDDEDGEDVAKGKKMPKKMAKKGSDDSDSDSEDDSGDEDMDKSDNEPGLPANTKAANGGFSSEKGASEDAEHFETGEEENDPTSMKSLVMGDETLKKGFEVSGFLEAMTDATTESVDGLRKSQISFQNEQRAFNARLQKAVVALGNMMLGVKKSQAEAEEEPVVQRPRGIVRKSDVVERFAKSETDGDGPTFTRAQTLDALTELVIKGEIDQLAVSAYETTSYIDPLQIGIINQKLKAMFG